MGIKVSITDDHPLILDGMSKTMGSKEGLEVVGTFSTAKETKTAFEKSLPDVLFLDINLGDGNGIDLCEELKSSYPKVKIIALTSFGDLAVIKSFMQRGGDGYMLKTSTSEQLVEAIEKVMANQPYLHPDVQKLLLAGESIRKPSFIPKLTRREKEVLKLIVEENTTAKIAEKLFLGIKTIETHRQHLLEKLEVKNTAGLVRKTIERGLLP
jgi:DNA-binding NarL/FixJ family response regulator